MANICLSTWSLHERLGPRRLTKRGPDGVKRPHEIPHPQTMALIEFLDPVRERTGLDRVEICAFHVPSREPGYAAELKEALRRNELTLVSMPIDAGNISIANDEHREDDLREIEGWMDFAAELGAKYVRSNASSYVAQEELGPLDVTIASYDRLADRAAARGMQMTIENHGGLTTDPEVIVKIVEAVGPERLKVCLDTGGFPPVSGVQSRPAPPEGLDPEPLYAGLARIAPYTGIVHAKGVWFDESGEHRGFDLARTLRIVKETGFDGPVSIEYGGSVDEWTNVGRIRRTIDQVFG